MSVTHHDTPRAVLYKPARHEPLADIAWDAVAARAAVDRILLDVHAAFDAEQLWPIHPLDRSPERPAGALKPLFNGAAGVIWAQQHLQALDAAEPRRDYSAVIALLLALQHEDDLVLARDASQAFVIGDAGLLLLHWLAAPSERVAEQLHDAIAAGSRNPALGIVWGAGGALLAAVFMYELTGSARWQALFLQIADRLWAQ